MVGIEGIVVGIWVPGNGGKMGFGRVGFVGSEGKGLEGKGGIVGFAKVGVVGRVGNGVEGKGCNVASAGGGAAGVSRRWRAA